MFWNSASWLLSSFSPARPFRLLLFLCLFWLVVFAWVLDVDRRVCWVGTLTEVGVSSVLVDSRVLKASSGLPGRPRLFLLGSSSLYFSSNWNTMLWVGRHLRCVLSPLLIYVSMLVHSGWWAMSKHDIPRNWGSVFILFSSGAQTCAIILQLGWGQVAK